MKNLTYYMRALHRDIGFFTIGLTLMFALSGVVLVYRDLGFLQYETQIERRLSPNLEPAELEKALHIRGLKVIQTKGETISFREGSYNSATGVALYKARTLPFPLDKLAELHRVSSKSIANVFVTLYAVLLLFLAISPFWMFKKATPLFRRGIYVACAGFVFSIFLLLIL